MSSRRRGFSPEFKAEAVKMVLGSSKTVNEVAREIHIGSETLRNWVKAEHAEDEPPLTPSERARLKELERENRELRLKCEFLGKCSAFFAREYR